MCKYRNYRTCHGVNMIKTECGVLLRGLPLMWKFCPNCGKKIDKEGLR